MKACQYLDDSLTAPNEMQDDFMVFFGFLILCIGLWFPMESYFHTKKIHAGHYSAVTVGELLDFRISSASRREYSPGYSRYTTRTFYSINVKYAYEVSGEAFIGRKLDSTYHYFSSEESAKKYIEKHLLNKQINVFYDEEKPSNSYLVPIYKTVLDPFSLTIFVIFLALSWFVCQLSSSYRDKEQVVINRLWWIGCYFSQTLRDMKAKKESGLIAECIEYGDNALTKTLAISDKTPNFEALDTRLVKYRNGRAIEDAVENYLAIDVSASEIDRVSVADIKAHAHDKIVLHDQVFFMPASATSDTLFFFGPSSDAVNMPFLIVVLIFFVFAVPMALTELFAIPLELTRHSGPVFINVIESIVIFVAILLLSKLVLRLNRFIGVQPLAPVFNRKSGTVLVPVRKRQYEEVRFADLIPYQLVDMDRQKNQVGFTIFVQHTHDGRTWEVCTGKSAKNISSLRDAIAGNLYWRFIRHYMDASRPLPDVPSLELFRKYDPVTVEYDLYNCRTADYWQNMSKEKYTELVVAQLEETYKPPVEKILSSQKLKKSVKSRKSKASRRESRRLRKLRKGLADKQ